MTASDSLVIAYRKPLPCEVPPGGQALRLINGQVFDPQPVRPTGRLTAPGGLLLRQRAEAVIFPALTEPVLLEITGLRSAEAVEIGLSLRLTVEVADPVRFLQQMLGERERYTAGDLAERLTPIVRNGLNPAIGACSLQDLYQRRADAGWLGTAVEASLHADVNLFERSGLRLVGVEAFDLHCQVYEAQQHDRLRWYLQTAAIQVETHGRRQLDQEELSGLVARLQVKEQLVLSLERMAELETREASARDRLGHKPKPGAPAPAPAPVTTPLARPWPLSGSLDDPALGALWRIFCPRCGNLTLAASCARCGWQRPAVTQPRVRIGCQVGAKIKITDSLHPAGDLLCLATETGEIVLLDRFTLKVRHRRPLKFAGQQYHASSNFAADEQHIYVGAVHPQVIGAAAPLLALHRDDLSIAWARPTGGAQVSAPAVADGLLFAASSDNQAWALDAATGEIVWQHPLTTTFSPNAPAADSSLVVFPSRSARVEARDLASGKLCWSYEAEVGPLANTPLLAGERVYLAGGDGALICLDRGNGKQIWSCPTESHRGLLTQPVLAGSRILVGSRDHCLHAVDLDGNPVWTYPVTQSIASRPLVIEDVAYLAGLDKQLHALDLISGKPIWPQPLTLGERVYADLAGDGVHIIALGYKGTVWAAPRHLPKLRTGAQHEAQGRFALAVAAHALANDLPRAAALCSTSLHLPVAAAQLFQRADQDAQAAEAYKQAELWDDAERAYRQAGQISAAAKMAERAGRLTDAASSYEEVRRWAEAARLYEQLGGHAQAAELYRRAGDHEAAHRCFEAVGDHANVAEELVQQGRLDEAAARFAEAGEVARAVELYLQQGKRAEAAAACERAGDHRQAAQLWEKEGQAGQAIRCYRQDGSRSRLEDALVLCRRSGDWRQEVEVLAALGHDRAAGERALAQAAQHEQTTAGKDRDQLAELFALAASHFQRAGLAEDEEPRTTCMCKVRYYRGQPDLRVLPQPGTRPFVVGEVNVLQVLVQNVGLGKAEDVTLRLSPALAALDGDLNDYQAAISSRAGRWQPKLNIVPNRAGRVRLSCILEYHDRTGQPFQLNQCWEIEVHDKPQPGNQVIYVQEGGVFYQSGRDTTVVQGDLLQDNAQKGDRVTIERHTAQREFDDGMPRCQRCRTILAAGAAFCDQCGHPVDS